MEELNAVCDSIELISETRYTLEEIKAICPQVLTNENPLTFSLYLKYNENNLTEEEIRKCYEIIQKLKHNQDMINKRNIAYLDAHKYINEKPEEKNE